ncbi:MAG: ECF transporter S component [Clostridia bacterium]|nr:ECF transporter S component [Clostridia bacterium]
MKTKKIDRNQTVRLATAGILTAVVIVFQFIGASIKFGTFSVSLVLIPIVVGAALGGKWVSTWLGFVFSVIVLLSGDASAFLTIDPIGTVITVILKGSLAGLVGGFAFELLKKINTYFAVIVSAILVPMVNTGIFLIGCRLFFFDTIKEWAIGLGFENAFTYMIVGLVGVNFLFELAINIILSPSVVGAVKVLSKKKH